MEDRQLDKIQDRLWREDPERVTELYDAAILGSLAYDPSPSKACGLLAEKMRQFRRQPRWRDKRGMTLCEIAEQAGMKRETLACLMGHHGYLETVPYGGPQRRRLVSDQAFKAELGHDIDASQSRIAHLEGRHRASVFPVFYPEHVPSILWTLDYEGIVERASRISSKKQRLCWLLSEHFYLPTSELATLSGYSRRGIEKMRVRETPAVPIARAA